jgi:predicted permease
MSFAVALLFAATPASPASYVLARQLGGDAGLMAGIITVETALSVLTMSAILIWLGGLAPG